MLARRKKMGSDSGVTIPENRLLRLFRSNDFSQGALISLEDTDREEAYVINREMIRNTMLEAEYQKTKAQLAFRNKSFC